MKMNLPNKLTITRIALIPLIMFFYMASFIPYGYGKIVALVLFVIASVTDFLDGYIERKYNIVTDFGKFADSIAAVPGCDRMGPTTALNSMMCYRQQEAGSGFVTQLKFDKSLFCSEQGLNTFIQMAQVYFEHGGQQ